MNWTIPNLLSITRLLAAPCVAITFVVFERPDADRIAVLVFIAAAITDYFDGLLARALGQESALGRMLDPVADKAMVIISLAIILSLYDLEWPIVVPAVVIILREVLISGLREFLGDVKLVVTRVAKWKTTLQMFAICLLLIRGAFLIDPEVERISPAIRSILDGISVGTGAIGLALLWIAAWFTVVTGFDYIRQGLPHLRQKEIAKVAVNSKD